MEFTITLTIQADSLADARQIAHSIVIDTEVIDTEVVES